MVRITNLSSFSCLGTRSNQEDYIIASLEESNRIFILCDGMGGHRHGEIASKTIAEAVFSYLKELNPGEYEPVNLQEAVDYASGILSQNYNSDVEKPMGTTLVVVAINKMSVLIGHIGDSRCYKFDKDANIVFRTKDHSKVQEAVDAEILTEEEAWGNPHKNILTRCLMAGKTDVKIDVDTMDIEDGDTLLLCSDGVTDALKDKQIRSILMNRSIDDAAELINTECEINSHDNYSGIIISLSQDEPNIPKRKETTSNIGNHPEQELNGMSICHYCGNRISKNSQFCPSCGKRAASADSHTSFPVNSISDKFIKPINYKQLIKKYSPILYTASGIVIGFLSAWGIGVLDSPEPIVINPVHPNENDFNEHQFSGFINDVCRIDGINHTDSILQKDSLQIQYQEFLQNIHKNVDIK